MRLKVERFVNELMSSNCYIVIDEDSKHCLCIDPASEKSLREIEYISEKGLTLDYIIATHEHTDHTWGVNALKEHFPGAKLICSELCEKYAKKESRAYFLFYYDNPDYRYELMPADVVIGRDADVLKWQGLSICFLLTPGHSRGAMCIDVDGMLFTGDTIMPYKPYLNGKGSNEKEWEQSVRKIEETYPKNTIIYPGHGDPFEMLEARDFYRNYFGEY